MERSGGGLSRDLDEVGEESEPRPGEGAFQQRDKPEQWPSWRAQHARGAVRKLGSGTEASCGNGGRQGCQHQRPESPAF